MDSPKSNSNRSTNGARSRPTMNSFKKTSTPKLSLSIDGSIPSQNSSNCASRFVHNLFRKKQIDLGKLCDSKLSRCLNLFDLTALGIGSTLGAGIYVVAGSVAKQVAGPAVIFSFLIAAVASVFAGLCYAEFGARVPKAGSAYVYSYVTVGEIWAFIIGWNLILEYMIGCASVARAWSATLDAMLYKKISTYLISVIPLNVPQLSEYPDFLAFSITIISTLVLIIGVKSSSRFNNIFTTLNIIVVLFVIVSGIIKGNIANWRIDPIKILTNFNETGPTAIDSSVKAEKLGNGGFFPFGFSGVLSGAATCFYAFIGFDAIATTGEEVKNPQRTLPISIIVSLLCCFIAYVGVSAALTLMMPYFLLDADAPIPFAFSYIGWYKLKIVIALGSMCGLSTSLMGSMFPLPRVIYAMASDGLLFRFLSRVNPRLKTPIFATIFAGTFAGVMAMLFDLKELVDMMSIGTLLAYTLVAVCVLLLRYRPDEFTVGVLATPAPLMPVDDLMLAKKNLCATEDEELNNLHNGSGRKLWRRVFYPKGKATEASSKIVNFTTTIMCISIACFCLILVRAESYVLDLHPGTLFPLAICGLVAMCSFVILFTQPQNTVKLNFKVPCVPVVPALSVFINLYLMMKLGVNTWIRFAVWMFIGFLIYFLYGMRHSSEKDITSALLEDPLEMDNSTDKSNGGKSHRFSMDKRYKDKIKMLNKNTEKLDLERNQTELEENLGGSSIFGSKSTLPIVHRVNTQLTFVPSDAHLSNHLAPTTSNS